MVTGFGLLSRGRVEVRSVIGVKLEYFILRLLLMTTEIKDTRKPLIIIFSPQFCFSPYDKVVNGNYGLIFIVIYVWLRFYNTFLRR